MAPTTRHITSSSVNDEPVTRKYVEDALAQIREMIVGLGAQKNHGARQANQFSRLAKVEFPKFSGEGVLGWIFKQLIKTKRENVSWVDYKDAITMMFGSVYDDPVALLKNAKYDKSVKEYQDTFDNLLSTVEVSEDHAISLYLGGLPTELEMSVRMFRPKTLSDAYCLTILQEAAFEAVKKKSKPFWYSLIVLPDNEEEEEEEYKDADETLAEPVIEQVQAHISLNALSGVSSFQTMRVIGLVAKEHQLHILIDSGSTHNFLDVNKAKRLGCKIWNTCPLAVAAAGEKQLISTSACKDFQWQLYGQTFTSDVLLLPLGGCDIVLGIQWLATLGDIK
ncbi:reverse transcriptase [Tanacetum coccineum]